MRLIMYVTNIKLIKYLLNNKLNRIGKRARDQASVISAIFAGGSKNHENLSTAGLRTEI
jgi:hypothetical protein